MTNRNTFGKAERLCSHKVIEALFAGGNKSFSAYPIRAIYMFKDAEIPEGAHDSIQKREAQVQLLISVSKRHFKHAVDRNRVKRQIRESFRLNKQLLLPSLLPNQQLTIAFIWLSDEHFETAIIEEKVKKLLQKLAETTSLEQ